MKPPGALYFIALLALGVIFSASAQPKQKKTNRKQAIPDCPPPAWLKANEDYREFDWRTAYYITTENAPLYADSVGAEVNVRLTPGDSVAIKGEEGKVFDHWSAPTFFTDARFPVTVFHGSQQVTGYVTGRDLGPGILTDMDNDCRWEELFITHFTNLPSNEKESVKVREEDLTGYPIEVCLVKKGKVLGREPYRAYALPHLAGYENTGLINMYFVEWGGGGCGETATDILFYWDGSRIRQMPHFAHGFDGDAWGIDVAYIFPKDSLGKPNTLLIVEMEYEGRQKQSGRHYGDEYYVYRPFVLTDGVLVEKPYDKPQLTKPFMGTFVADEKANVYKNKTRDTVLAELHRGDSIAYCAAQPLMSVSEAYDWQPSGLFTGELYNVQVRIAGVWHDAYMDGGSIGWGISGDVDNDGRRDELLLARYTNRPYPVADSLADSNGFFAAEFLVLKDGKTISQMPFRCTGLPEWVAHEANGLKPNINLYELSFQETESKAGSYLFYWDGKEMRLLPFIGYAGSYHSGVYHDFVFPSDSVMKSDRMVVRKIEYDLPEEYRYRDYEYDYYVRENVLEEYTYTLKHGTLRREARPDSKRAIKKK